MSFCSALFSIWLTVKPIEL